MAVLVILEQARLAWSEGVPLNANPYPTNTETWWAWHVGWKEQAEGFELFAGPPGDVNMLLGSQDQWERREQHQLNDRLRPIHEAVARLNELVSGNAPPDEIVTAKLRLQSTVDDIKAVHPPKPLQTCECDFCTGKDPTHLFERITSRAETLADLLTHSSPSAAVERAHNTLQEAVDALDHL